MAQRNRHDRPGRRHHIYNRGIAKRVMFPDSEAKRRFLALLLCSVRRGEFILEAFSILDTHFHILGRSTDVSVSYPMMRVQNAYSRYFNRRFRRDGSVPRGRFGSSPVLSMQYALTAVRYLDFNPVKARICALPAQYPFGSAWHYSRRSQGPAWLARDLVDGVLSALSLADETPDVAYRRIFGRQLGLNEADVVERRLGGKAHDDGDLDELLSRPTPAVAAWMRRKARLADGLSPWAPIAGAAAVADALQIERGARGKLCVRPGRKRIDAWPILAVGSLHDAAGLGCEEIARTLSCASSTAGRRLRAHRALLQQDRSYALLAAAVVRSALAATYPLGLPA